MPISSFFNKNITKKVDDFFTNYLRNTTSDAEIKAFYGDGNIVGRKGIPGTDREILDAVEAANKSLGSLRPKTDRPYYNVGGFNDEIGYNYTTSDMPDVINPETGRPWQMTLGVLPKDFGASSLTPAAQQFLEDFRVGQEGGDIRFATGPNIKDRIDTETKRLIEDDRRHRYDPEILTEKSKKIQNQDDRIVDFSGQPMTPRTWQELGYINQKPEGFKEGVLKNLRENIRKAQEPFSGVYTFTPVNEERASNPSWRAKLYQTEGLAGPLSEQNFRDAYGGGSKFVQRFTIGSEGLLPLQPYSEFFQRLDSTPPSALGTDPAPDFTRVQKAIGTRNYLIGRNILEGRGSLGAPVRIANAAVPTKPVRSLIPKGFLLDAGINYALGTPADESLVQAGQDLINVSGIGQPQLAQVERRGDYFVDTRNNTILSSATNPKERFENKGVAQKDGRWVPVQRGTVAGEPGFLETVAAPFRVAGDVWKTRSKTAANEARYAWNQLTKGKIPWWGK